MANVKGVREVAGAARGGGTTTAVAAESLAGAGVPMETEARGELPETRPSPRDVDPDSKLTEGGDRGVDGEVESTVVGVQTRLTIIESDGGVRLAGGPPGLTALLEDTAITMLPPPYRHYDSSSGS